MILAIGGIIGAVIAAPVSVNLIPDIVACQNSETLCWQLRLDRKLNIEELLKRQAKPKAPPK